MTNYIRIILNNNLFIRILFIFYSVFLTFFLLKPGSENSFQFLRAYHNTDKIAHFTFFFILALISFFNFSKNKIISIFLGLLFYAILTEVMQGLMNLGRSADFFDFIADSVGIILGYFVFKYINDRFN